MWSSTTTSSYPKENLLPRTTSSSSHRNVWRSNMWTSSRSLTSFYVLPNHALFVTTTVRDKWQQSKQNQKIPKHSGLRVHRVLTLKMRKNSPLQRRAVDKYTISRSRVITVSKTLFTKCLTMFQYCLWQATPRVKLSRLVPALDSSSCCVAKVHLNGNRCRRFHQQKRFLWCRWAASTEEIIYLSSVSLMGRSNSSYLPQAK